MIGILELHLVTKLPKNIVKVSYYKFSSPNPSTYFGPPILAKGIWQKSIILRDVPLKVLQVI
jgi:hypothetical protein